MPSRGEVTLLHIKKIDIPPGVNLDAIREPVFAAAYKYLGEMESRMVSPGEGRRAYFVVNRHLTQSLIILDSSFRGRTTVSLPIGYESSPG